jgi:hypothetical protein
MNQAGDGFTLDNTDAASNCYLNCCTSGGIRIHGGNFDQDSEYLPSAGHLTLTTGTAGEWNASPAWFDIPTVVGEGESAQCSNLKSNTGINMSSNAKLTVTVSANGAGDLYVWLGSGGDWSPTSSTYDIADGSKGNIPVKISFTEAGEKTESFDLNALDANVWSSWSGNSSIEAIGFASDAESVTFKVKSVLFGADADSGDEGGNDSGDEGGNDSGDEGNGQKCSSLEDHGHGTWYNNLDVSESAVVKCSFERSDILGTKYGALDKGLLLEDGTAKYCGMCVEAIAPEHNDVPVIIQIVDECPDCYDRGPNGENLSPSNTKFGDIDLSISAFKALLSEDHVSLGIGDFNWKEVACPWQDPLHIIVQGSNQWGVKVIVGNHVNRVAKVEVLQGSTYHELQRGVDNGWTSYHLEEGTLNEIVKTFKVTDIYGSEVEVSGIDFSDNDTNSKTIGSSNFAPCGLVTSNGLPNELDYVIAFPNPANTQVTFEGISEANTIEILNVNGQVVASRFLNSQFAQVTLDISELTSGIYVAKMVGSSNTGAVTFVKK